MLAGVCKSTGVQPEFFRDQHKALDLASEKGDIFYLSFAQIVMCSLFLHVLVFWMSRLWRSLSAEAAPAQPMPDSLPPPCHDVALPFGAAWEANESYNLLLDSL